MGYARWNPTDWKSYSRRTLSGRSRHEVFSRRTIREDFDPRNITLRESRDSAINPESTALIVAFDESGSMGNIPNAFVRNGLETLVTEILDRKPITDPHVMIMGVGDAWCDRAPLQVTQFEGDLRIAEQLKDIYLEGGGGGNAFESYNLPWYFAARRTAIDCFEKRGKKGYLFTVGDEPPPPALLADHVQEVFGDTIQGGLATADVLAMASRMYHVFHLIVEEGHFFRHSPDVVTEGWRELLGQRAMMLADYNKLAEVIVSAIEVNEGSSADSVSRSWSGDTSRVVARAIKALVPGARAGGVQRF
jgi:hypothetical protein